MDWKHLIKSYEIYTLWQEIDNFDLSIEGNLAKIVENIHSMDSTQIERIVRKIREEKENFQFILDRINKKN